jgi:hypothetical protein
LVKVVWAFFDSKSVHGRRARHCHCLDTDEGLVELARMWKEVQEHERKLGSGVEFVDDTKGSCRRTHMSDMATWFSVSTARMKR